MKKKVLLFLLLITSLHSIAQETPPPISGMKQLTTATRYWNPSDNSVWTYKGTVLGWHREGRYSDFGDLKSDINYWTNTNHYSDGINIDGNGNDGSQSVKFKYTGGYDFLYYNPGYRQLTWSRPIIFQNTVTAPAFTITNTPVASSDAVNKAFLDAALTGYAKKSYYFPEEFTANAGDGVTDALSAFNSIKALGGNIWLIPGKAYRLSATYTMLPGQKIDGQGATIKFSGITAINTTDNSTIEGVIFKGNRYNSTSTTERAILLRGVNNVTVSKCRFDSVATDGIKVDSTAGAAGFRVVNMIINNHAENCNTFIRLAERGEYAKIIENTSEKCDTAIYRLAGNGYIGGGIYINGGVGLYDNYGTNGGHSGVNGAVFNHNATNLYVLNMAAIVGNVYTGCSFQSGSLRFKNSSNIKITSGNITFISSDSVIVDNSRVLISHMNIGARPNLSVINGGSYVFKDNDLIYAAATVADKVLWNPSGPVELKDFYTDAANATTTETDLYSYTLAAGILATNGDKIIADYAGTYTTSATATRQLKIYFGTNVIFDSGALLVSSAASWVIKVYIVRTSSSTARCRITLEAQGTPLPIYTATPTLGSLTLSGTNILKITGTAAGTGAASSNIVAKSGTIQWRPAAF